MGRRNCHCKSGPGEFGPGGLNLLVSHVGEFCLRDHIPWRTWSVISEFGPSDFSLGLLRQCTFLLLRVMERSPSNFKEHWSSHSGLYTSSPPEAKPRLYYALKTRLVTLDRHSNMLDTIRHDTTDNHGQVLTQLAQKIGSVFAN